MNDLRTFIDCFESLTKSNSSDSKEMQQQVIMSEVEALPGPEAAQLVPEASIAAHEGRSDAVSLVPSYSTIWDIRS